MNGGAWCWGIGYDGRLGNGGAVLSTSPVQVTGLGSGVQAIAAGGAHTCALVNGGVWCWGVNSDGQLGNNLSAAKSTVPVQVTGLASGVQAISAGTIHTCAVVDGGAQCWGGNNGGQLGDNATTISSIPVAVTGLGSNVQGIAGGGAHTCALLDGAVRCWGANYNGQLGDATTTSALAPATPIQFW
jgi:alpha-tubulin suppressor-like RCC1 family protein